MPQAEARYRTREGWLSHTLVRQGCSIGAGAIICPGIELGAYSVIGAGAVVTKSVPPFALVVGNPARVVAHVCSCGQRLSGSWDAARCNQCGEEGYIRAVRLNRDARLAVND
jgi:UDP-2-acetamido-3-amino-2,3-dideoxy-glucuronate N-acetyltransferase